jgi:putative transcriptional regulator
MRTKTEKEILLQLGLKIRELRINKGLNQTEFANIIGKDQPSVNRLENGKINVGYLYLKQIANGLEIKLKDIVDF